MMPTKLYALIGSIFLTLTLSSALLWPQIQAKSLIYYYPLKATHFTTTNTFRASVSTSGQLNAIIGQADSTVFTIETTEHNPGSYSHWQLDLDFGQVLSGSNIYLTISGEGLRVGGNGRMGVTNNQFVELSLDGHLWQTVSVNWMCEINCALGWLPDVPLGAQQFRYLRLRTTFHHGDHRVNFDTVRVWNVDVVPLTLQHLQGDYQQTVHQLTLNAVGWPTPNPLVSEVTLSCPPGTQACTDPFHFYVDSPGPARFYVFEQDLSELQTGDCAPFSTNNPTSFTWYEAACDLTLYPGTAATLRWWTWVQPSEAVTLSFRADWGGETLEERISVPHANIKPLVFLPGFLGTYPPASDGALDPLLSTYDNLVEALQRAGYERGEARSGASLVIFGYDWRQHLGDLGRVNLQETVDNLLSTLNNVQKPYVDYSQTDIMGHSTEGQSSPHHRLPPSGLVWRAGRGVALG